MWASMPGRTAAPARVSRWPSATRIPTSWRRRVSSWRRVWVWASLSGRSDRPHGLREVRQHRRVERVGLGQRPGRAGEVARLARIDHHDRQRRRGQRADQLQLQTAGRLQHDPGRRRRPAPAAARPAAPARPRRAPPASARPSAAAPRRASPWPHRSPRRSLPAASTLLSLSGPSLQDAGSVGPGNCSGSIRGRGAATQALSRPSRPRGHRSAAPRFDSETSGSRASANIQGGTALGAVLAQRPCPRASIPGAKSRDLQQARAVPVPAVPMSVQEDQPPEI